VPGPNGNNADADLLRASIAHASPSQLDAALRDRRPWVRKIAEAEADRRAAEQADTVVCREPLRRIVTVFVARWNSERPPMGGQFAENRTRAPVAHVPAVEWLSTNSGVPRGTIENITRKKARSMVVPYEVADALVAAIGCPEAMYDGTLEATSRRNGGSCCSGSLTG
jgi:hypothetical protein